MGIVWQTLHQLDPSLAGAVRATHLTLAKVRAWQIDVLVSATFELIVSRVDKVGQFYSGMADKAIGVRLYGAAAVGYAGTKPHSSGGQYVTHVLPIISLAGTVPHTCESLDSGRLSPSTKYSSGPIVTGPAG